MRPDERNAAYLWDILDAALAIRGFTFEMSYTQYIQDMKTRMAVERAVEIMGEAARNITEDFKKSHPEIPWAGIIGQRNVLSHKYFALKHERIWIVVTEHIPDLINKLEPLIPSLPQDTED
jgi:uncharacterized protein with HEPN domain